jgi:hypothetical protein
VILQRRAGTTRATSVAYEFRRAGDVTLTNRAVAAVLFAAKAAPAAISAPTPTIERRKHFT